MPHKDPEARRRYQREWLARRRAEWLAEHGPCVECGSWEDLQIDHRDRSTKVDHRVFSWSQERRDAELAKCQVLCQPCHAKKSAEEHRSVVCSQGHSLEDADREPNGWLIQCRTCRIERQRRKRSGMV